MRIDQVITGATLDRLLGALLLIGLDGAVLDANDAALAFYGYSRAEILSLTIRDVQSPQDRDSISHQMHEARTNGIVFRTEHLRKDGSAVPVEVHSALVHGTEGDALLSAIRDMTKSDLAEKALNESERSQKLLFDGMGEGFAVHEIVVDAEGRPCDYRFLQVNPAFEKLTGLKATDILGKTVLEVLPGTEPAWIERYGRVALTGESAQFEDYSSALDRYFEVRAYAPEPGRFAVMFGDVAERKQTLAALEKSEASLRKAQRFARIGSWTWDIKANRLEWSDEMFRLFGIEKATFTGALEDVIARAIHPDDRPAVEASNASVMNEGVPVPLEYRILWPDGTEHVVWAEAGELVRDEDGAPWKLSGTVQDITERKQSEERLKENEQRLRAILEASTDGFWLVDNEGNILAVNEAYSRMSGYTEAELLTMRVSDVDALEGVAEAEEHIRKIREQGSDHFETRHRRKDGTIFDVEINVVHQPMGDGRQVAFMRDVTESKRAAEALKASEDKFKYLFEHSMVAKSLTSPTGVVNVNDAFCDLLGYTRAELGDRATWQQLTHPDDIPGTERIVAALLAGKMPSARFTKRYIHKDGRVIWADVSTSLRRDAAGVPEYFMTTILDITERKNAEDELRASERWLSESQRVAHLGHYIFDIQADHWSGSPALYEVLGATNEDRDTYEGWLGLMHPDDRQVLRAHFEDEVLAGGATFDLEYRIIRPVDGEERWVHGLGSVEYDADGRPLALFGIIQDVTERRLAENAVAALNIELEQRVQDRTEELAATNEELIATNTSLQETNAILEEATRAKSDFLASMSHELRTPLNSIIGFSDILLKGMAGELNEEQGRQIGMIHNSGRHLLGLVNEVLDLAKIESGRQKPTVRRVDIIGVVRQMFDSVRPMADEKGLAMVCDCPDAIPKIATDGSQVGQIVLNLISNAVKFTERGEVSVQVSEETAGVAISVKDSGRGIPADELERVFDDFYQVMSEGGLKSDGTGLGLAVCRRLATALGATIEVESELGSGSTFTLHLPR